MEQTVAVAKTQSLSQAEDAVSAARCRAAGTAGGCHDIHVLCVLSSGCRATRLRQGNLPLKSSNGETLRSVTLRPVSFERGWARVERRAACC